MHFGEKAFITKQYFCEINELISMFLSSKLPALAAVSSIVCEVNKTVFFFIKHILNLKYTKQ